MRQAHILRAGYSKEHQVNYKGVIDLVTEVDHQSEAFLLGEIQGKFPDHHIFSEESGIIQGNDEHIWYIDPLDGTVNYAHHIPIFCVSIAYASHGELTLRRRLRSNARRNVLSLNAARAHPSTENPSRSLRNRIAEKPARDRFSLRCLEYPAG